jgi:hypothetical protein
MRFLAIGALLSSYSSLDGSDGLRRSFPTKRLYYIEMSIRFPPPMRWGIFNPLFRLFALHLSESRPGPARVVPTTGG